MRHLSHRAGHTGRCETLAEEATRSLGEDEVRAQGHSLGLERALRTGGLTLGSGGRKARERARTKLELFHKKKMSPPVQPEGPQNPAATRFP